MIATEVVEVFVESFGDVLACLPFRAQVCRVLHSQGWGSYLHVLANFQAQALRIHGMCSAPAHAAKMFLHQLVVESVAVSIRSCSKRTHSSSVHV